MNPSIFTLYNSDQSKIILQMSELDLVENKLSSVLKGISYEIIYDRDINNNVASIHTIKGKRLPIGGNETSFKIYIGNVRPGIFKSIFLRILAFYFREKWVLPENSYNNPSYISCVEKEIFQTRETRTITVPLIYGKGMQIVYLRTDMQGVIDNYFSPKNQEFFSDHRNDILLKNIADDIIQIDEKERCLDNNRSQDCDYRLSLDNIFAQVGQISDARATNAFKFFDIIKLGNRPKEDSHDFGILKFFSNSCNIDSLLMIIFSTSLPILKIIKDTNVSFITYKPDIICSSNSKIKDPNELNTIAKKIKKSIVEMYDTLASGKNMKCMDIREMIQTCLADMRRGKSWVYYPVDTLYTFFTELFPRLPPLIQMFDFMTLGEIQGQNSIDINDYPYYVFHNGGAGKIHSFNSFYHNSDRDLGTNEFLLKKRVFTEYMSFNSNISQSFNRLLRLEAVVILEGATYENDSGSHYYAFIRGRDNNIYKYDDTFEELEKLNFFPDYIWEFDPKKKITTLPFMYFYRPLMNF